MKKIGFILLSFLFIFGLTACGEENSAEQTTEESTANGEETTEIEKDAVSEYGARSNPFPLHEVATIETNIVDDELNDYAATFTLQLTEVIRGEEAQTRLKEMNQFNEDAPEGYEWILIHAKATLIESETEDYSLFLDGIMNFEVVAESGDIYSGDLFASTDPDFSGEMYKGGTLEGYFAKLVKTDENATARFSPDWITDYYFNLQ